MVILHKIMVEENYWDRNAEAGAVEGPVDSVGGAVVLKENWNSMYHWN